MLRLEDTDLERSTDEAIDQILDALEWLGLDWDEGPFRQTERSALYAERLEQLLSSGAAYWDTAGAAEVKQAKEASGGAGYRGTPVPEGTEGAAVRLRVPDEGETVVRDVIRGESAFENRLLDDFVIARSDRTPLYNFAVAVDDTDMGITHVVRGEDHLSNTPRQLLVLEALGAEPPLYAHLPLLHGTDGKPLSKRHGAASVQELREIGYLPEAVRNYLALLGWGYDAETTFFTTEDLIEKFSLERVSRSPAVFDEQKLSWMNGHYIREMDPAELTRPGRRVDARARPARRGRPRLAAGGRGGPGQGLDAGRGPAPRGLRLRADRDRSEGVGQGDGQGRRQGPAGARARGARRRWSRSTSSTWRRRSPRSWRSRGPSREPSTSPSGWRSRARPSRRGSSRAWRCWAATRRCAGSTPRWPGNRALVDRGDD